MPDVKWIKIVTDIFDDEKILLIESLPSSDSIIVIWFKLLCLAGKNNNSGVFLLNDRIAYTDEMLATIFRRDVNTVRLALKTFESYGMIELINNVITIPNWSKHQTLDQMEERKEYMKTYMKKYRANQKMLAGGKDKNEVACDIDRSDNNIDFGKVNSNDNSKTNCEVNSKNACKTNRKVNNKSNSELSYKTDSKSIRKLNSKVNVNELEEEKERDLDVNIDNELNIDKELFINAWNSLNLNKVVSISNKRYSLLKELVDEFGEDKVVEGINNINKSSFLKGNNDRNWVITFDWFLKHNNFIKVLENNYSKQNKSYVSNKNSFNNFRAREIYEDEEKMNILERKLLGWED